MTLKAITVLLMLATALAGTLCAQAEISLWHDQDPIADGGAIEINVLADLDSRLLFHVRNTGNQTLAIVNSVDASAEQNVTVSIDQDPAGSVGPGTDTAFAVMVKSGGGNYRFDLTLLSNDPDESPYVFTVYGRATDVGVDEIANCSASETAGWPVAALLASLAALAALRLRRVTA